MDLIAINHTNNQLKSRVALKIGIKQDYDCY